MVTMDNEFEKPQILAGRFPMVRYNGHAFVMLQ